MGWLFLVFAITSEIIATSSLKVSDGFSRLVPSIVVVIFYAASFYCLAQALSRGIPLGIAYAIWSGVGLAIVAAISSIFFDEPLGPPAIFGLLLIGAGVVILEASTQAAS